MAFYTSKSCIYTLGLMSNLLLQGLPAGTNQIIANVAHRVLVICSLSFKCAA